MTLAAARAACAALALKPWDDAALARAVNEVTVALLAASPQVTPAGPGAWWVGTTGLAPAGAEGRLLRRLERLVAPWDARAVAAAADSCVAARAATWAAPAARVVPPGGDAAFLARAPLALLPLDAELRAELAALGFTRAGELAALAPADVEARFGAAGLAAWRLARGDDRRRPQLARAPEPHEAAADLPVPADTLEPVRFLLRGLLDRLVAEVARAGRAVAAVELVLETDGRADGATDGREGGSAVTQAPPARADLPPSSRPPAVPPGPVVLAARLPRPLARTAPLLEHLQSLLERAALPGPVLALRVRLTELAAPAGEQGDLLQLGWRDPSAAAAAFARLRAALGADAVVRPVARDAHAPERRGAWLPADDATPAAAARVPPAAVAAAGTAAFRLLRTPEPADHDPLAASFVWRGRRWAIDDATGPERLSGDWWGEPYARDYWRWDAEGVEFLAFRVGKGWWVQGWMD